MSKDKLTRTELEQRLREMEQKVSHIRVLAAELEGDKRKKLAAEVERLAADVKTALEGFSGLSEEVHVAFKQLEAFGKTLKQLVNSVNSNAVMLNVLETWMDKNHPDWDEGTRQEAEMRSNLLKERASIAQEAQKMGKEKALSGEELEERRKKAARLWEIAKILGCEGNDAPMILAMYLQARDVETAAEFVKEVEESEVEVLEEVLPLMKSLLERLEDLRNEVKLETGNLKSVPPVDSDAEEAEAAETLREMRESQAKASFETPEKNA